MAELPQKYIITVIILILRKKNLKSLNEHDVYY